MSTGVLSRACEEQVYAGDVRVGASVHRPLPGLTPVRRRANPTQGQALVTLGHAVEYLIDSRLWQPGEFDQQNEQEAIQILMRMSRAVFSECPEVVSMRRRFQEWVAEKVA
jgi:hypothetical protein